MNEILRLLQVEDSESDAALIVRMLEKGGYRVHSLRVEDSAAMEMALAGETWDAIIADYRMPDFDAPAALALLQRSGLDLPFIVVSGTIGEDTAVEMMRSGAHDYLLKNDLNRLTAALEREIQEARQREARTRQEEALRKALLEREGELERSNADLQAYAYSVSHDLQEPLRMISVYIELLSRKAGPALNETCADYMAIVRTGAKRMHEMLQGLLEFSRAGQEEESMSLIDCSGSVAAALQSLSLQSKDLGARISVGPLPSVFSWKGRLEQVFQNLIGNALKYRKPSTAPQIVVSAARAGEEWIFQVKDNGIGFDGKYADKIFGVFKRLHSVDAYEGTGIGLSVTKRIVERHGGRIWAESAVGEGSTFYFALPVKNAGGSPGDLQLQAS